MKSLTNHLNESIQLFESYSSIDKDVVKYASSCDLYLIGGTALEVWCRYLNIPLWRKRSINDIDFFSLQNNSKINKFQTFLLNNDFIIDVDERFMKMYVHGTSSDFTVDILFDYDTSNKKFFTKVNGINIMDPVFLFSSKFDRMIQSTDKNRISIDRKDLSSLLLVIEKLNMVDELEKQLSKYNYTTKEENILNSIIEETYSI